MNHQINSYLAFCIIALVGGIVSVIIVRVTNNISFDLEYSSSAYTSVPHATTTYSH